MFLVPCALMMGVETFRHEMIIGLHVCVYMAVPAKRYVWGDITLSKRRKYIV